MIYAQDHPRPVQHGGRGRYMPKTPCLFAPADDRNGLATPTAGGAFNRSRMAQHVRAMPARSISLASPEAVNGASGNEDEGTLGKKNRQNRQCARSVKPLPYRPVKQVLQSASRDTRYPSNNRLSLEPQRPAKKFSRGVLALAHQLRHDFVTRWLRMLMVCQCPRSMPDSRLRARPTY